VIGLLLPFFAAATTSATPIAIISRQEIRDGKLYNVLLAPSCKSKRPTCKPWQQEWTDSIRMLPGDVVTPDGLTLREVTHA
jgi:hypothetical protein